MSKIAMPHLSLRGFEKDRQNILVTKFGHFLASRKSQDGLFVGIESLTYIIDNEKSVTGRRGLIVESLTNLLTPYFDTVTVTVNVDDSTSTTGITIDAECTYLGNNYNLGRSLSVTGSTIKNFNLTQEGLYE